MTAASGLAPGTTRVALGRAVLFLVFWLMIAGYDPADLPIGVATAALATWASLRLLPPSHVRLRKWALAWFVLHFLGQSARSGVQVAWLAFRPSMPIRPGLVTYRTNLSGSTLSAFCALSSLLPGTLPTGNDEQGGVLIHCLDVDQPVAADLAREEALFSRMLASVPGRD
jgi:multicomponent Na+:H+ antiporter subunit E